MFIELDELKTVAYAYQLQQITEEDDEIILQAIATAVEEAKSYITPNSQKAWQDGRPLYDVEAIFLATGASRNPLILQFTKVIALWHVIQLSNVDLIYEHVKERYDRARAWFKELGSGKVNAGSLPLLEPDPSDPNTEEELPFRFGSRKKFNHE